MKDLFSGHSQDYAQFRPGYPQEIYAFLDTLLSEKQRAWDCATGNGQVASVLAKTFQEVYATDISEKQLVHAIAAPNITYSVQSAERTTFPNHFFDLITVAQAIHWFDFDAFYQEVYRTLKPNGIFAVIGYGLNFTTPEVDAVFRHFYFDIIGKFWDSERRYLDEHYQTIPFPFNEIEAPPMEHRVSWSLSQFMGYLQTWSAVKHYEKAHGTNPLALIEQHLRDAWGNAKTHSVRFPMYFRVGRLREDRNLE